MTDRGIFASYLLSSLSNITNPESFTHIKLVIDHNSNRVNDLLIHGLIRVTLYNNLLTFRDTGKEFELQGDLLKMITNKIYNIDLAKLLDKTIMYQFAIEMYFDVEAPGK